MKGDDDCRKGESFSGEDMMVVRPGEMLVTSALGSASVTDFGLFLCPAAS
jgi:sialic acid synthase SpsE